MKEGYIQRNTEYTRITRFLGSWLDRAFIESKSQRLLLTIQGPQDLPGSYRDNQVHHHQQNAFQPVRFPVGYEIVYLCSLASLVPTGGVRTRSTATKSKIT